MLCTRCQQREAHGLPPEGRAKMEAEYGTPLPTFFRNDLCRECWREWSREWFHSPEGKAEMERFGDAVWAKLRRDLDAWQQTVRSQALKVLDFADKLAGKFN